MNHHSIVNKMNYSEEFKDMIGALLTHINKFCFGWTLLRFTENSADRYEIGFAIVLKCLYFLWKFPLTYPWASADRPWSVYIQNMYRLPKLFKRLSRTKQNFCFHLSMSNFKALSIENSQHTQINHQLLLWFEKEICRRNPNGPSETTDFSQVVYNPSGSKKLAHRTLLYYVTLLLASSWLHVSGKI